MTPSRNSYKHKPTPKRRKKDLLSDSSESEDSEGEMNLNQTCFKLNIFLVLMDSELLIIKTVITP